ncbi:MAG: aldehyde oxidase [Caulobacteraceae bacterium]|nr:aldehyde oxidase [Caulobacteraceae bacterium]
MASDTFTAPSRRGVLQAAAGLVIGLYIAPGGARAQAMAPAGFRPNAFLRIAPDSTVTVAVKHIEMGQGPMTGLTTLVAEELDADWSQMRAEHAPADAKLYNNLNFGSMQATGGSSAIANSYEQMRKAGATARAMLVQAAADSWQAPVADISVDKGVVRHVASGRQASFGELAERAGKLTPPKDVALKDPKAFRLIGREGAVKKLDVPAKTNGSAVFTQDIHAEGLLTVVVARPSRFGGKVVSFDDTAARAARGVVDVRRLPMGVAVYATGTYPAIKGRKALKVVWDDGEAETRGTPAMLAELQGLAKQPGVVAKSTGDLTAALKGADRVIETEYAFPFLAHAPMEPVDGTLFWDGKSATARFGSQLQTIDQAQIAGILGLKPEQVAIETLYAGGSFGRRIDLGRDMIAEMAHAAKAIGPGRPVKLIYTREDDIQGGFYRPMMVHRMRGAIRGGKIVGWGDTVAGHAWAAGTAFEPMIIQKGLDSSMVEGAQDIPYAIAAFHCDAHIAKTGVPTTSWRSVGSTHTAYAVECFIDQLLEATKQDPVAGRLALMGEDKRYAGVLKAAAEMADWGAKPAAGRARGVAVAKAFGTYVAQIAEVSLQENGEPRVHKVWCAVDCGVVVNPDVVRAQMEGGIGFGLGHILFCEVPLDAGRPVPTNFGSYRSLRIQEMPQIEVRAIASAEKPSGVGEPGVPPIGPAVANALARLGRERPTQLPIVRTA